MVFHMSETQTLQEAQAALAAFDPEGYEAEAAGDIIAEIMGERAAFGDSAPGSEAQLQAARAFFRELDALSAAVAALTPPPPPVVWEGDDYPF